MTNRLIISLIIFVCALSFGESLGLTLRRKIHSAALSVPTTWGPAVDLWCGPRPGTMDNTWKHNKLAAVASSRGVDETPVLEVSVDRSWLDLGQANCHGDAVALRKVFGTGPTNHLQGARADNLGAAVDAIQKVVDRRNANGVIIELRALVHGSGHSFTLVVMPATRVGEEPRIDVLEGFASGAYGASPNFPFAICSNAWGLMEEHPVLFLGLTPDRVLDALARLSHANRDTWKTVFGGTENALSRYAAPTESGHHRLQVEVYIRNLDSQANIRARRHRAFAYAQQWLDQVARPPIRARAPHDDDALLPVRARAPRDDDDALLPVRARAPNDNDALPPARARALQRLMDMGMGWTRAACVAALRDNGDNADRAAMSLMGGRRR